MANSSILAAFERMWQHVTSALSNKSDISHNHNDVYYTEVEIDSLLEDKANVVHNHDNSYDVKGSANAVQANLDIVSDKLDTHTSDADIHVTTSNKSNWNAAYTHSQSAHARTDATNVADSTTNGNVLINGTETNVYTHPNSGVTAGTYKSVTVNSQGHITAGTNPTTLAGYGITDAETKGAASSALASAKEYTDSVAAEKSDKTHNHDSVYDTKGAAASALASAQTYADSAATTAANTVKNDLLNGAGGAYDTLKELGDLIDDNTDAIDALETVAAGKADKTHSHAIADVSGLQSALDGKAASSHGTHVSYSTTAPVMDGTASVGTASTVARSDHKHPTDTSRASKTEFDSHTSNKSNPHGVTKAQVGLGNVDNTADADKSVNHATSADTATTASKVTIHDSSDAGVHPIVFTSGGYCYKPTSTSIGLNPSTGNIIANTFYGALSGNAATATRATQDGNGNTIATYYMKRGTYERIEGTSTARKNLDNYTTHGFYNVKTAYVDNCPSGIGIDADLLVYPWDSSGYECQEITETAACTTSRRWIRHKNGSTWTAWVEMITSQNISSQSVAYANNVTWSSSPVSGGVTTIGASLSSEHSANRIAYLNPNAIAIESSDDGGSTWVDAGHTDSAKVSLVTTSTGIAVGSATPVTTNHRTRITLTAQDGTNSYVYTSPKKLLINVSSAGHGMNVLIETKTGASSASWSTVGTYTVSGWSGWNDIPLSFYTFGGSASQTTNIWQIRLTFINTSVNSSYATTRSSVLGLRLFGDNCWTATSAMGNTGHIYSYDYQQNVTFPGSIYTSKAVYGNPFYGNLKGNADTATKATQDASGNTITSTYATKTELTNGLAGIGWTNVSATCQLYSSSGTETCSVKYAEWNPLLKALRIGFVGTNFYEYLDGLLTCSTIANLHLVSGNCIIMDDGSYTFGLPIVTKVNSSYDTVSWGANSSGQLYFTGKVGDPEQNMAYTEFSSQNYLRCSMMLFFR